LVVNEKGNVFSSEATDIIKFKRNPSRQMIPDLPRQV